MANLEMILSEMTIANVIAEVPAVEEYINQIPNVNADTDVNTLSEDERNEAKRYVNNTQNVPFAGKKFGELTQEEQDIRQAYYRAQRVVRGTVEGIAFLSRETVKSEKENGDVSYRFYLATNYVEDTQITSEDGEQETVFLLASKYLNADNPSLDGLKGHFESFGKTQRDGKFDRVSFEATITDLKKGYANLFNIQHRPIKAKK